MPGVDLHTVRKLRQPLQRVEQPFCALSRVDGEIRSRSVADEQRIPGQRDPLVDDEGAVLRPVTRCVDDANRDGADV